MAGKRNWDQHEDKHRRILDCAAAIIAQDGWEAVSIQGVGRSLDGQGYGIRSSYGSREELILAVLDRQVIGLLEVLGQPEDWPGTPTQILADMAAAYAERADATRDAHRALLAERHRLSRARRDAVEAKLRWLASLFDSAFGRAMPAAARDQRLREALVASLLGLLDGQILWRRHDSIAPTTHARAIVAMLCSRTMRQALQEEPAAATRSRRAGDAPAPRDVPIGLTPAATARF